MIPLNPSVKRLYVLNLNQFLHGKDRKRSSPDTCQRLILVICRSFSRREAFLSHVRTIADLGFKLKGDQVTILSLQVTFFKGQKCAGYLNPQLALPGVHGRLFLSVKLIWDGA